LSEARANGPGHSSRLPRGDRCKNQESGIRYQDSGLGQDSQ
jgi:hypothetical protein